MATIIIFPDGRELEIDATMKQGHGRKATLTKHKVEKGAQVSDHVVKENYTFSLDGIVSEVSEDQYATTAAFEKIEDAYNNNLLLKIETTLKTYENMILTGYSVPREASQGFSLFFSLEFEEVRFAETKTIKVDNIPKAAVQKNDPKLSVEKKAKANQNLKDKYNRRNSKGKLPLIPV